MSSAVSVPCRKIQQVLQLLQPHASSTKDLGMSVQEAGRTMCPAASAVSCALTFKRYLDVTALYCQNAVPRQQQHCQVVALVKEQRCAPVSTCSTPFHNVLAISPDQGCTAKTGDHRGLTVSRIALAVTGCVQILPLCGGTSVAQMRRV